MAVRLHAGGIVGARDRGLAVRRFVATLVVAVLLAGGAAAGAASPTLTPGVLVVGLDMPSPGFQVGAVKGSQVLVARGFEISLARALALKLGVPAVHFYQEGQFPRLFSAGPKPWDLAIAQITITPARAITADFSVPYLVVDQGVLLSRSVVVKPTTVAALRALQLCALAGSTGADLVATRISPTRRPLLSGNVTLLTQAVQSGRCAAAIYDAPSLATLKAQAPARYGALAGVLATGERYGVALPKGSALTAAVDAAIGALIADGTIARLQRQWLATNLAALPVVR
jgi:polar amino acid transport system substrate-binding protein